MDRAGSKRGFWLVPLLVGALLIAGCGDDKEPAAAVQSKEAPADETTTSAKGDASEPIERTLDKTGWWGGFAITIDTAQIEGDDFGGITVTLATTYENLGDETAQPPTQVSLVYEGESVSLTSDAPSIPGKGTAEGEMTASIHVPEVEDGEDPVPLEDILDGSVVTWGESNDNQTLIPLSEDGEVESVQPAEFPVTGQLVQSEIIIDLLAGHVAPSYQSGEKGKAILTIDFKLSCAATCIASGYNVSRDEFSVTTPDGQSVVADQSVSSYCCTALYPGTVVEPPETVVGFKVPMPTAGNYVLTYANVSQAQGAPAPTAPLTVP